MKTINVLGKDWNVSTYGLVNFDDKEIVATAIKPVHFTANDIDNIICTALEGGIGYWARLDKENTPFWGEKPNGICVSEYAAMLILSGSYIQFRDRETGETGFEWQLTLGKLIKGYQLNCKNRSWDCDIESGDATTADCIIQYALFGEVVYG